MENTSFRYTRALALSVGLLAAGTPALAVPIYALTTTQRLVSFDTGNPSVLTRNVAITGIAAGQTLVGMDFRPATGQLFALGYDQASGGRAQLYTLNLTTGVATSVARAIALNLGAESAANIGFDFNPTVDRIRVVTADGNRNLRLNPNSGALVVADGNLAYVASDVNAGRNPNVSAAAYTNSFPGASSTTLYDVDLATVPGGVNVILALQNPPNNGSLTTRGSSTQSAQLADLDVDIYVDLPTSAQTAYTVASYRSPAQPGSFFNRLGTINLTSGAITDNGTVGGSPATPVGYSIVDIAAFIDRPNPLPAVTGQLAYGVTGVNTLISFDTSTPSFIRTATPITGVNEPVIAGLDARPATGQLYLLGYDPAGQMGRLYVLNPATGAATPVGVAQTPLALGSGTDAIDINFNPVVDRIRVIGSNDRNYRLNPDDGALTTDGTLTYAPSDLNAGQNPDISSASYTNSFPGSTATTLYDIDRTLGTLTIQNPPNAGTLNTVGPLGFTIGAATGSTGFDIYYQAGSPSRNIAYLVANPNGSATDNLYTVDLTTGAATLIGAVGGGTNVNDFTLALPTDAQSPLIGQLAYAVAGANTLLSFDTGAPSIIRSSIPITGIVEPVIGGLDARPATGQLYVLGYNQPAQEGRLYVLDPATGVATPVGTAPVALALGSGTDAIDINFNPVVDRVRVIGSSDTNYRLNPDDGTAIMDGTLTYAPSDPNAGQNPDISSASYTNSFPGSASTALYGIDRVLGILNTLPAPNSGVATTIGPLGFTIGAATGSTGFDIYYQAGSPSRNIAYLVANPNGGSIDNLYTVDLASGATTLIGAVGGGTNVSDFTLALPTALNAVWTGAVSTDWNTAGNWSTNLVPTIATSVTIPVTPANQPILSGTGAANNIRVNPGARLTISASGVLQVNGNVTNNGTFTSAPEGEVSFVKPTQQLVAGSGAVQFGSWTIGTGGAQLTTTAAVGVSIRRVLTVSGTLVTGGKLTLLSDASGTAMVVNDGAGVVSGSTTVQRYITVSGLGTTSRGYRHLSAPVSNTTISDLRTNVFTPVVNPSYNSAENPELTVRPYPNVFAYDEQRFPGSTDFQSGYYSPASLLSPMEQGRGYAVYMLGTSKPDFVGTLGNGDVTRAGLTRTGTNGPGLKPGFHLLGNPYPSPIDWDLVTVPAGMDPTVYVNRPTGGTGGVYTAYTNGVGAPGTDLIGVGQGFFALVTTSGGVDFTFTNAARVTDYANPAVYRTAPDTRPLLALGLRRADQPAADADAAYVYFQDDATAAIERGRDAIKLRAEGESASIFTLAGGQELAINGLPTTALEASTIPLGMLLPVAGTYVVSTDQLRNLSTGAVLLVDNRTGTTYDLTTQAAVTFTATQAGADLTRFSLRFGRGSATTAASTLSLDVYPNPVGRTTNLTVTALGIGQATTADVAIFDALGRAVLRQTVLVEGEAITASLDTRALRAGAYTLRVTPAGGVPLTRKVVVE